jgi:putative acetyltransferase
MSVFKLRNYQQSDLNEIVSLFNATIQAINKKDYTAQQIAQWVQTTPDYDKWHETLASSYTIVAEQGTRILGFGSITESGELNYLYVDKAWIGYGIGKAIAEDLIEHATKAGAKKITAYSSITAKPFFEQLGLKVIEQKSNYRNDVLLLTYLMEKTLQENSVTYGFFK